uniref:PHD finger protein 13 n=1 Tax=Amazona collaria TaxID=241587 RepID=A0A8B9FR86_9PSIT
LPPVPSGSRVSPLPGCRRPGPASAARAGTWTPTPAHPRSPRRTSPPPPGGAAPWRTSTSSAPSSWPTPGTSRTRRRKRRCGTAPAPPNSTGGTIDSDSWDPRFNDIPSSVSLPAKNRKNFSQLKRAKPYASLFPRTKPGNFLPERKQIDKIRKKKKLKRRETEVSAEEDFEEKLLELEAEDSYVETPMSPSSEGDAPSAAEHCSVWDSDTPSSGSCPAGAPEPAVQIQSVGKRTVIRQGKQVVFRDEDGTGDDEDIMVDSDDDSWDLVTCFCMKPFAGRPMIECNECHTWIHLSCAKIRKSNVPEVYICQKCRDSKFDIRRSNRSRTGSRRRFLD